jgi:hypothetical protein
MSRDQPALDNCAEQGGVRSVGGVELSEPRDGRAILCLCRFIDGTN